MRDDFDEMLHSVQEQTQPDWDVHMHCEGVLSTGSHPQQLCVKLVNFNVPSNTRAFLNQ